MIYENHTSPSQNEILFSKIVIFIRYIRCCVYRVYVTFFLFYHKNKIIISINVKHQA